MSSSRPDIIPTVVYKVMEMRPTTILDVGAGHGKWGVLCAEYLKYWCGITPQIDGVEAFPGYDSPVHAIYRKMYHDDVLNMLDQFGNYDLILGLEVIEHMTRQDGLRFRNAIKNRYIISTPSYWNPPGATGGNEYDRHLSLWTGSDFDNHVVVNHKYIVGWR